MILLEEVLNLHDKSIDDYGGAKGIRDKEMLLSAIERPFMTFGGEDLYPSHLEKAAALIESIIINHPFVDGNKRTGFLLLFTFLRRNNIVLPEDQKEVYEFVIRISTGETRFDQIVAWLQQHTEPFQL